MKSIQLDQKQNHGASLGKGFEPALFESKLYDFWLKSGCFEASDESVPGQKAFSIVIPPPNVTGALHMGHALTNTIQDILVRWKRMRGENVLWLPGTDHAGIATQNQVEKAIAKEGKGPTGRPLTRHDLGREKFLERTWQWKHEHASTITNQLKRLGSSLDWSRERFTMDEGLSKAVREVFVRLYEEKLIYRGERIINWCTRCASALSDLEVLPKDRKGKIYQLRYDILDGNSLDAKVIGSMVIATTRPETMLGDTAVAVHPEDERYTAFHGKFVKLPLMNRVLPILVDPYVDQTFGTGALKITPAHDFNDWEIGLKHSLPIIQVMGKEGTITSDGGSYAGLKFSEAREKILADLELENRILKIEDHQNRVGCCERCDTVAEPLVSKQWFVKIDPLAKPAIAAVETGAIEFRPKTWEKTYFEWMHNIRDWCISRQLWWGHQIPAWYCKSCDGITVSREDATKCAQCAAPLSAKDRDEDVLDTWFSSGLWPFSTMGWPEKTKALDTFYPTAILETGFDIIFFWVARMIMMGLHFTGKVPFHRVYLHAMVRDEKGEKMSKSKGNVIDPLELIQAHGADPLRFTLAAMAGQGRDIKLSVDRVEGYRAFANKIWNAVKFFHLQVQPEGAEVSSFVPPKEGLRSWIKAHWNELLPTHHWMIQRLEATVQKVDQSFEAFELNEAANALYEFGWLEFCDWGIEFSKIHLKEGASPARRTETLIVMRYVLEEYLKALHPIMPFVTEELWQSLPGTEASNTPTRNRDGKPSIHTLMLQPYSVEAYFPEEKTSIQTVNRLRAVIEAIRNFRGENQLSPKKEFAVKVSAADSSLQAFFKEFSGDLKALSRVTDFQWIGSSEQPSESEAVIPLSPLQMGMSVDLRIDVRGLVNFEEEKKRLQKEIEKCHADVAHSQAKLEKPSFVEKAPAALIQKEKDAMDAAIRKREELEAALVRISRIAGGSSSGS
jgi:valyl-tRNA synthetase